MKHMLVQTSAAALLIDTHCTLTGRHSDALSVAGEIARRDVEA